MKMEKKLNYWEGKIKELEEENIVNLFKKKDNDNVNNNVDEKIDIDNFKKAFERLEIKDPENNDRNIASLNGNIVTFKKYVGLIVLENKDKNGNEDKDKDNIYVIKCYPKYFNKEPSDEEFEQILQVINKYNSKYQINWYDIYDDGEKDFNKLEASLYIINDYLKNGLYSNQHEEIELNGEGEILWDKSINENIAFIQNKKPYYLDLFTRNVIDNENDYFRRLHACVISECIRYLKDIEKAGCNLFKLCDVNCDELTDAVIDDFGSTEYILYRLESEIRVQYITQKQNLLKLLHTYIKKEDNILQNDINCSLFGSANFHWIWEDVCTNVFNSNHEEFQQEINKPHWVIVDKEKKVDVEEKESGNVESEKSTLRPDVIVDDEIKNHEKKADGKYFGIFDAKYYNIEINNDNKLIGGQPGVGDITKQYFYQLSFKERILNKNNNYKYVQNVLLFPDLVDEDKYNGRSKLNNSYVYIELLKNLIINKENKEEKIGSGRIRVVWLDTKDMYKRYLNGEGVQITGNNIFSYIPLPDDEEIIK